MLMDRKNLWRAVLVGLAATVALAVPGGAAPRMVLGEYFTMLS
jgi:hypothetical protein